MRYRRFIAAPGLALLLVTAAAWGQVDRSGPAAAPPDRSAAAESGGAAASPNRQTVSPAQLAAAPGVEPIEGYDFEHIVDHWQKSMTPFRHEMDRKSKDFIKSLDEASSLLDAGREREAIGEVVAAIERVLVVRDRVMGVWPASAERDKEPKISGKEELAV